MHNPTSGTWGEPFLWEEEPISNSSAYKPATATATGTMSAATTNTARRVLRTTMFRIAEPANQQKLVEAYNKLATEQKKVCMPVLVSS